MTIMLAHEKSERVAVFVDGANLYHSIKNYYKGMLDYGQLLSAAVSGVGCCGRPSTSSRNRSRTSLPAPGLLSTT